MPTTNLITDNCDEISRTQKKLPTSHSVVDGDYGAGMKSTKSLISRFRTPHERLMVLWICRLYLVPSMKTRFVNRDEYDDPELAQRLGFPYRPIQADLNGWRRRMREMCKALENESLGMPKRVDSNLKELSQLIYLNELECLIISFLLCARIDRDLHSKWDSLIDTGKFGVGDELLSQVLKCSPASIKKALQSESKLMSCGILQKLRTGSRRAAIDINYESVADHLFYQKFNAAKFLRIFGIHPADSSHLEWSDYQHLNPSLEILMPYLKSVTKQGKAGVNILLHGPPGTGKTQLSRLIGNEINLSVYELNTSDDDGDLLNPYQRISSISLAQNYFRTFPVMLVFDEAEDILRCSGNELSQASKHKGFFNQLLESNTLPIIWISNSISDLDAAAARRFDFILEVPIPPKSQRSKLLKQELNEIVSNQLISQLADLDHLSPAIVSRARRVIQAVREESPHAHMDKAFCHVVDGVLKAQGHSEVKHANHCDIAQDVYEVGFLNTPSDLPSIAANLRENPAARLCLYGPPGTGKTAFGYWLAKEIDRPIDVRRVSDLISPYVGMTEKTIAKTFANAAKDGSVLLIDEADSLLQKRDNAKRSWEITQVNEMLTQIECFPGVLIASTNFIDHLDDASLRRFDLKLEFGYLKPQAFNDLLSSWCRKLALSAPSKEAFRMAASCNTSTPGDFAAVARRHRFQPLSDGNALLDAVIAESGIRSRIPRTIGFQSTI